MDHDRQTFAFTTDSAPEEAHSIAYPGPVT